MRPVKHVWAASAQTKLAKPLYFSAEHEPMAEPKKRNIGLLVAGFGLVIGGVAIVLLVLNIRTGNLPIAAGLALMVIAIALTMFGVTLNAHEKKQK